LKKESFAFDSHLISGVKVPKNLQPFVDTSDDTFGWRTHSRDHYCVDGRRRDVDLNADDMSSPEPEEEARSRCWHNTTQPLVVSQTKPYFLAINDQMIEKRRRDRINNSLLELRRLVPAAFEKQGSTKLEKAEILQMTVDHLRGLHSKGLQPFLHFLCGFVFNEILNIFFVNLNNL
jgi:hypothetical protein